MQPWPLVSPLVPSTGEASEPEDCRRRILRIRRLGVRIPPGALCVETDDQALNALEMSGAFGISRHTRRSAPFRDVLDRPAGVDDLRIPALARILTDAPCSTRGPPPSPNTNIR